MNKTLEETIRSILADSELPKRFWAEALSTGTYLHSRSSTNSVQDKIPYEAWTGNNPNVSHLRIFGCDAFAHVPKDERSKLDSKTRRSIFLGYGQGVKGYHFYNKAQKRIFYSRNVVFDETRSTKQDDLKDVAENKPSIELKERTVKAKMIIQSIIIQMRTHNKKDEKDVHQTGMVNGFTLLKKKILLLQKKHYQVKMPQNGGRQCELSYNHFTRIKYGYYLNYFQKEKLLEVSGYSNESMMLMETLKDIKQG